MARAKRTVRTDARRRHRAEAAARLAATGEAPMESAAGAAPSRPPATRPGITTAFRAAFRPVDLRADLRLLPVLVRNRSFLIPSASAIAATVAFIASASGLAATEEVPDVGPVANIAYLAVQFFVFPPPAAGAFLSGFLAPRASWLVGLLVGIVAAACFAVMLESPVARLLIGTNDPGGWIAQGFILAPVGASVFASAAAWYRRFLNLANPNRGQRPGSSGRGTARRKERPLASRTSSRR